ncbi:phage head morphogenesis, SPP1 gp7 family domain protein [Clostridioides difficile DA00273]|nr:phage head morphogenesis, SPP1 gp7 family domain protein [Clostridioides difficile DA00273]
MTESAFFASASRKDCFNDLDVEKYEIIATLDLRTSNICRELDGKVFDMKDYQVGITAPPFHCRCRTTTAPFLVMKKVTEQQEEKMEKHIMYHLV